MERKVSLLCAIRMRNPKRNASEFRRCFLEASTPRESGPDVCRTCHFFTLKKTTMATSVCMYVHKKKTQISAENNRRRRFGVRPSGACMRGAFKSESRVVSLESYVSLPCTFVDSVCVHVPDLSLFTLTRNVINAYCVAEQSCINDSDALSSGERKVSTQLEAYALLRNGWCY